MHTEEGIEKYIGTFILKFKGLENKKMNEWRIKKILALNFFTMIYDICTYFSMYFFFYIFTNDFFKRPFLYVYFYFDTKNHNK